MDGDTLYLKSLKDLGEFLKSKREGKGIKVEEIQRITKIRAKYIHAIECGDFSLIPGGDVYIRGFLKNYAEGIGIDHKMVLQQYKYIINAGSDNEKVEQEPAKDKALKTALISNDVIKTAIIVFIALTVVLLIFKFIKSPIKQPSQLEPNQETQTNENKVIEEQTEEPRVEMVEDDKDVEVSVEIIEESSVKTIYGIEETENINVDVKALDRCWISVKKDGKSDFEGIVNNGETRSFQANTDITMRIGNPSKVELTLNGVDVGVPGGNARDFVFIKK